jgi:hypothetical protein
MVVLRLCQGVGGSADCGDLRVHVCEASYQYLSSWWERIPGWQDLAVAE